MGQMGLISDYEPKNGHSPSICPVGGEWSYLMMQSTIFLSREVWYYTILCFKVCVIPHPITSHIPQQTPPDQWDQSSIKTAGYAKNKLKDHFPQVQTDRHKQRAMTACQLHYKLNASL